MIVRELTIRYEPKPGATVEPDIKIMTAADAAAIARPRLEAEAVEVFAALFLTTCHTLIGWHVLSRGTIDATPLTPAALMRVALLTNAAALILVHNHPSGDATPSAADVEVSRRMVDAGTLLGVAVLDHIIVGDTSHASIAALGLCPFK